MPKVKRLEIYGVSERSTRYAMATRGEMDWALSMTEVFYERVKKDPNLRMVTALQEHAAMGEMVATYWKAIGIKSELTPLERFTWISQHHTGKMKGANFMDAFGAPTINARLNYLFGPQNYGNYPDIQTVWDQYAKASDPKTRKELIARVQKLIYDRTMVIPMMRATVPSAIGPRVKGDPFKFRGGFPLWFPSPLEDLELNE